MTSVTRRRALVLSSSSLAVALAGCNNRTAPPAGGSTTASTSTTDVTTSTSSTPTASSTAARTPTTKDWIAFARTVQGPVELPGTSQYNAAKLVFDTHFDGNRPAAVMVVERTEDIARAMQFATTHGLQIAPRGGGHSYVGASAANGTLVLDLRPLHSVSYSAADRSVRVSTGANLYAVKSRLAAYGRALPTGTCPTVGAAGLTLGGGLGVESRAHGLTCDRMTSAQLVLPDGRTITADAHQNADVFWALRGGGGGLIGLVTRMRFATHAATRKGIFTLTFGGRSAVPVMTGWARWIATTTRTRWAGVHVDAIGGGNLHVSILGVCEAGDERAAAHSVIAAIGVSPTTAAYRELSYLDSVIHLGGGTTSPRQGFTAGSDILAEVDTTAASAIAEAVIARSRADGAGSALLDPLTGAVAGPGATTTAFPWRDHVASVQWYAGGTGYSSAQAWIADAHRRLAGRSSGGYVNYLESGQSARRYFAGNTARLTQLRQKYDPARRIHCGITI